jgi:hypothetical protein
MIINQTSRSHLKLWTFGLGTTAAFLWVGDKFTQEMMKPERAERQSSRPRHPDEEVSGLAGSHCTHRRTAHSVRAYALKLPLPLCARFSNMAHDHACLSLTTTPLFATEDGRGAESTPVSND